MPVDPDKYVLVIERRYVTKSGKGRFRRDFYPNARREFDGTYSMIPWLAENAPAHDIESVPWTNLLRWYLRTKDLPGAREAYDTEAPDSVLPAKVA